MPQETLVRNKSLLDWASSINLTLPTYKYHSSFQTCIVFRPNTTRSNRCNWSQLKDASGFNAKFRGNFKNYLNFDLSLFYLSYNNHWWSNTICKQWSNARYFSFQNQFRTVNKGLKGFNLNVTRLFGLDKIWCLRLFFRWVLLIVVTGISKPSLRQERAKILPLQPFGQPVENAPRYIHNLGLSWSNNQFSSTMQYRMSGRVFTDANNTTAASVNGYYRSTRRLSCIWLGNWI
jgi:Fe(3+) dicitrate transport protein